MGEWRFTAALCHLFRQIKSDETKILDKLIIMTFLLTIMGFKAVWGESEVPMVFAVAHPTFGDFASLGL